MKKEGGDSLKKRKKSFFSFLKPKREYTQIEEDVIKRFGGEKKKKVEKKTKTPSKYVNLSARVFADFSRDAIKKGYFRRIRKDLVRANLRIVDTSYISVILMTTLISVVVAVFVFLFFLFFNLSTELPIITSFANI